MVETNPEDIEKGPGPSAEESAEMRCGGYRFRPRATEREEGEVKIGAGTNWSCPVEAI